LIDWLQTDVKSLPDSMFIRRRKPLIYQPCLVVPTVSLTRFVCLFSSFQCRRSFFLCVFFIAAVHLGMWTHKTLLRRKKIQCCLPLIDQDEINVEWQNHGQLFQAKLWLLLLSDNVSESRNQIRTLYCCTNLDKSTFFWQVFICQSCLYCQSLHTYQAVLCFNFWHFFSFSRLLVRHNVCE